VNNLNPNNNKIISENMKNLVRWSIGLLMMLVAMNINAQTTVKFGHVNSAKLIEVMPETPKMQASFKDFAQKMEQQLETLQVEFNNKYKNYLDTAQALTASARQDRERELNNLKERIEAFQTSAQQEISTKRDELFKPIMEKAQKAIEEVSREEGYTYVFDLSAGSIIFVSDTALDLMPSVKKKLGIK
jgi:outer membrane protein